MAAPAAAPAAARLAKLLARGAATRAARGRRRGQGGGPGPGVGLLLLLLVAVPGGLVLGLVLLSALLGGARQEECSPDGGGPLAGDFSGPGSLGGMGGTGISHALVQRGRSGSPYAGSRITPRPLHVDRLRAALGRHPGGRHLHLGRAADRRRCAALVHDRRQPAADRARHLRLRLAEPLRVEGPVLRGRYRRGDRREPDRLLRLAWPGQPVPLGAALGRAVGEPARRLGRRRAEPE